MKIFGQAPVRHLVLTGAREAMGRLGASKHLRKIRSLDLRHNELGDAEAQLLSESRHLGELRWLCLAGNHITRDGGRALAQATHEGRFPSLQFVDLGGNPFDPADRPVYDDNAIVGFDQPAEAREITSLAHLPWIHRGQRGERFELADRYL